MDTLEAIRKRRSIRKYTGDPIPREDLETIVDAGRWAASGHNKQPWVFVVITEREMIEKLTFVNPWLEKAAAVIAVVMDPDSQWWMEDGAAAVENMLLASTALGYGSCWIEGATLRNADALKGLLNIPDDKRLFTLVSFGVPVAWPTREKKPLDEILHWETY